MYLICCLWKNGKFRFLKSYSQLTFSRLTGVKILVRVIFHFKGISYPLLQVQENFDIFASEAMLLVLITMICVRDYA